MTRKKGGPVPFATSHVIGGERTTKQCDRLDTNNDGAVGYLGPVKIDLRKGAGLLGRSCYRDLAKSKLIGK